MRYYCFALGTCAGKIKEKSKINLKEYAWENPIAAMNNYMYKHLKNGRFVRKMLEEAEMNLAERVTQMDESKLTTKLIMTIEERDIPEPDAKNIHEKKPIGFCVA